MASQERDDARRDAHDDAHDDAHNIVRDDLALSEIEKRYLSQDGYDKEGHLSTTQPGDTLRELIHEIRQTRTAIRLAQATFVSKTDLEERLREAGENVTKARKQASRRLAAAISAVALTVVAMGVAALAYVHSQNNFRHSQYVTCIERSTQSADGRKFLDQLIGIFGQSQDHKTGQQVIALLQASERQSAAQAPRCDRLK